MNIAITFKGFEPSEHLKKYAYRRFGKLSKYVDSKEDNSEMQVNLGVEKFRHLAEVSLAGDNINLTATEASEDMYATIDMVLDKLESQLRKLKDRDKDRRKGDRSRVNIETFTISENESGMRERTIMATDSIEPKPMYVDEAAMQLDTLDYNFLVFRNADTERINVIYRMNKHDFGLIDPGQ
ncbi:ribosome hibernation-promoting factor, HPF/YfiA family [Oceanidesulfovibrio marinus]|uniref:Ribosome hibernation promoting factor n=1 Tax=Oceanidesulfovibrio marinus TaxID=370038 RepID=A0A6P1ZEK0_9BACT|nr:ribosome-associated translation inhibitor RaiA [Oceanidesulfovibrio marinus]QJT08030.1 ribosome-associated translation inhibitor RaiA [Oceanidesulfovibrio marinus]TVM30451.1 ribosome-associated translation inhibitor RaiA [Oceanidesulfovibrio marinus]